MPTAVAEPLPAYGFAGSAGKKVLGMKLKMSDEFFIEEEEEEEAEEVLTESSSIGAPSSPSGSSIGENSSSEAAGDGEGEEEEEVESKLKVDGVGLGCLDALEDSLPIKSGLSSFYAGKSKSFTSLAEAAATEAVKELAKPENPFNKRRRILANWSRRASCSSLVTATYLPPLLAPDHALAEGDEGEEDDSDSDEEHRGKNGREAPALPPPRLSAHVQQMSGAGAGAARRSGSFRSPRSFSLSDLRYSGGGTTTTTTTD